MTIGLATRGYIMPPPPEVVYGPGPKIIDSTDLAPVIIISGEEPLPEESPEGP
jgi:hypothetical protein